MSNDEFDHISYLNDLCEQLNNSFEQPGSDPSLSAELDDIYLHVYNQGQEYLIHWHDVNKQVWVASPKSGAHHFQKSSNQKLCSTRDPALILEELLEEELDISL